MMMTLRALAISSFPSPGALDASVPRRDSRADLQDAGQFAQVADLVRGRPDPGRQRLGLAVDPRRVHADPLRAEHVDVRAVADEELGLTPALDERLVARLEGNLGRVRAEGRMDVARGGAHPLPVQLDLRHPLTVEANQRVEEVEEDRRVRHQSGFRPAYPSSRPCQWRMSRSPYFQHKLTSRPSRRCGKSTSPSPRSFGVPPSSTIFSSASCIPSVNSLMRSVSARHCARSRTPPPASAIRFCSAWSFSRSAVASVCAVMTSRMTRASTGISASTSRGVK